MNSSQSIRPLSVGNVVSAAIRLFRSHLGQYLGISLKAVGWMCVPWIPLTIAIILFVSAAALSSSSSGNSVGLIAVGVLLIPVFLVLLVYCGARAITNEALIGRLAFQDLMNQPESTATGWQQIRKRLWHFWLARFMVGLIVFAVSAGMSILQNIMTVVPSAMGGSGGSNGAAAMLLVLITLVMTLVSYGLQLWIQARLFVPELPIAVEENVTGDQSINRAWSLSKGHGGRIAMIIFVAGLITVPLFLIGFIPAIFAIFAMVPSMSSGGSPETAVAFGFISLLGLGFLLALALSIFVMPFWQTIKAVVYYDLRSRREGMGLELRDR
jgi:hypothetical protein